MKREIWRGTAGRVMLELLYGQGPHLVRKLGGQVRVQASVLASVCRLRADRLDDTLGWLGRQGLVLGLEWTGRHEFVVQLKTPEGIYGPG